NPLPPENFDVVLDCTGTDLNHHPLFLQAVEQGLIKLDELNLGFETDQFGQSVVQDGVFILGPQLRAHFWECTAVPELREQAKKLARQLLNL
ncbi:MAG: FAD/NAD(P)-binding protein, partial [Pseudobdellovibrio sp.]